MSLFERIAIGVIFGAPAVLIIGYNYARIFLKKLTGSPGYFIGGILGAVAMLAILGEQWKEKWYFILIPIVLDWGLMIVSFILALILPPKRVDSIEVQEDGMKNEQLSMDKGTEVDMKENKEVKKEMNGKVNQENHSEEANEKKQNFWTMKRKKGIFEYSVIDLIVLGIMIICFVVYFLAPKAYSVTTARYNAGTDEQNEEVLIALGSDHTEEDFGIYFQWYNEVHELGHGLIRFHSKEKFGKAEEEQLVNDFAVAYWMMYGEEDKLARMEEITSHAMNSIQSDAKAGQSYMDFAKERWGKRGFFKFKNYGWFQFNSSHTSLQNKKDMDTVLKEMKIEGYSLPENPKKLVYGTINEEVSNQVLEDAVENINSWGLSFPKVYHHFRNDPNANYSKPIKDLKFFGF